MNSLLANRKLFKEGQKILITTHYNPDADAIGSSLSLKNYFDKIGLKPQVWLPSSLPHHFSWMKGAQEVLDFEKAADRQIMQDSIGDFDWIFCLDFSGIGRIHGLSNLIKNTSTPKVIIDHHLDPENFADYYLHDTKAASTCELIFRLMQDWGDKSLIDSELGACMYAGIMADTGSFRHPNTTSEVHKIVAELIDLGVNTNRVHRKIFDSSSIDRLRFLGHLLSKRLEYLSEYHLALMWLTEEDQKQFHSQAGDTEGFVNYGLQVEGAIWAILLIERNDGVKLSFRSIEPFAVNQFAAQYFEGGGHKNASGGRIPKSNMEDAKKILMDVLPLQLDQINQVKNL
ncbi:bifunctional oligoribonuclease/PAP phosphatase NrnA [Sandaracinomonas limnophila]|uniref:Bifunctional oligoribonuclease/PAP phosphatase NrnA n=1 Tax=Sandaracinomonas limnophila TaxID=1862386 RepID=A0A437PRP1_9BACT|nr:bifunctional oligoribonuclease/PAP phosphatase NrnA [Sandaracinomonas limnophila]RVU24909.1 bifunctional oligoribonuclease/PAP phosphatase NrnA [Sandaracinomonas limnophila]